MQQRRLQYNPLSNKNDIRVIQLLTEQNCLADATEPVRCKLVHVSLEEGHLNTGGTSARKGSDGTWPILVAQDVDKQFETSHQVDSDKLYQRNIVERMCPLVRIPEGPYLRQPSYRRGRTQRVNYKHILGRWSPTQDPEADLPWRYTWGDFVALSYFWGDPSVTCEIFVNSEPVRITANLEAALRALQGHSRIQQGFMVWVDALCINQADLNERAAQVARMNDIYARAWHVVIWLGTEEKRSDLALLALRHLSLESQHQNIRSSLYHRIDWYIVRVP
jgi:hypothetical protein